MTSAEAINRQQAYLVRAARELTAEFELPIPEEILMSYGFPKGSKGGRKLLGQCWYEPSPKGIKAVIFIAPSQWSEPVEVLHVLLHELIHAATPGEGHKGAFKTLARKAGLEGKLTATTPGETCKERLRLLGERLGDFPAAAFDTLPRGKKQTTRLRLWECECGIKVRVAKDEFHATCEECGEKFQAKGGTS
jgi:hypothetical protein